MNAVRECRIGPDGRASYCRRKLALSWVLQLAAAGILLQTLYFKFSGAPESVYIFSRLGLEPWGRIATGVAELIAAVLLLTPRLIVAGAALGLAIISGALVSHATTLGVVVQDDDGLLFSLAVAVFGCTILILFLRWPDVRRLAARLVRRRTPTMASI